MVRILNHIVKFTQDTKPLKHNKQDIQTSYQTMPEMHSELPLAVKQLLDINEPSSEYETDWKNTTPSFADRSFEERNLFTKTPVVVHDSVKQEKEVGRVLHV